MEIRLRHTADDSAGRAIRARPHTFQASLVHFIVTTGDMQAPHPATYPAAARPRNGTLTHPHNGEDGLPGGAEKKRDLFGVAANGGAESEEKDVVLGVDEDQAIDGVDPVYAAKARVLNRAIMNIGMGRYQWQLFFVIGYGWAMDNMVSPASG